MSFIKDKIFKVILAELMLLFHYSFEGGNHNIIGVIPESLFHNFSFLVGTVERKYPDGRDPLSHFLDPFAKHDFRYNNDVMGISVLNLFW